MSNILTSAAEHAGAFQLKGLLSESLELCVRTSAEGRKVLILINHSEASAQGLLPGQYRSFLSDARLTPATVPDAEQKSPTASNATLVELPPQGVAVLAPETAQ
jgi:hypothetical protein